ncbi:MAG: HD domain-containing protein [Planctomycetaceae bacterium]|nr:HD domain-containing protein [Planctomycetaceae bacterium]
MAHVAGLMADPLRLTSEEKRLVQHAALLHDVGHGPFSHVSEVSLSRFADRSKLPAGQKLEKIHELVTAKIIEGDPEIARLLTNEQRDAVVKLLADGFGRPLLKQVISGPLDADKQDYLLRDSKFCGVEYGIFDPQQLQRSLLAVGNAGQEELMIDPDGVHAVEQFVLAKYYMTTNVYRHRVRVITDQMIGRAIRLGIEADGLAELERLYRFDNTEAFIRNYQKWDDARFLETFCPQHAPPPGTQSGELLQRLRSRRLLKQVYSDRIEDCDARIRESLKELPKATSDVLRDKIESEVAAYLAEQLGTHVAAHFVIAHAFGVKSVRESALNDEAEILVRRGNTPRYFSDESKLFASINAAFADNFVEVYAPIEWPLREARDSLRESWRIPIRDIITRLCLEHRRTAP